ncbi:MAG: flagellar biosynthesis protein FlhA [Treponema sp.]|jgi:flagellar biosynthesis protein FlhA|nr:flagellar biosynthesis protein FlhA [Treponema sp.]
MANGNGKILNIIEQNSIAVGAIVVVLMLIIPLPAFLLDFFMALNLTISIIILLIVLYTPNPASFISFPRVILLVTLFGLGINVSSTRLILTEGKNFAGNMIKAFSTFVVGGNSGTRGLVVGMVIFIILIIIQTVVITKGATRVSEVAARFSLDSMNNKMFAVDAELNSGSITEEQAREKKHQIQSESDFYSHMDGASKFVSGNVKAGIVITVTNLVAGMIIGMVIGVGTPAQRIGFSDAVNIYSRLTIGDGLLSQIPALLLSFSTGLIVTGSSDEGVLSEQLRHDFSVSGQVYCIAGAAIVLLGLMPGMPHVIMILLGSLFVFYGYRMINSQKKAVLQEAAEAQAKKNAAQTGGSPKDVSPVVPLDPLSLELGYALCPLVDKEKGAELLERVTRIRREAALDLGLVVPRIRIIDNMMLDPNEYSFKIRGIEAGRSKIRLGYYMCMDTGGVTTPLKGEATKDPAFGMPAIWVPEDKREEAERAGYAVVDPPTVIATHLTEIIRTHAAEILGRQEVSAILEKIKENNPVVVDEVLTTCKFTYGEIEKVLQNLLCEQVSIRNMVMILETLANFGPVTHNTWILSEKVREALGLQICMQYADTDHRLRVLNLSQNLAEKILNHKVEPADGSRPFVAFDPVDGRKWVKTVSDAFVACQEKNYQPIVLCPAEVRMLVKFSTEREIPGLVVISVNEVMAAGNSISIEVIGEINEDAE